jgi:GAF domain-containing protein
MGDRCVGVLSLARVEPRPFLEDELEALDHLAGQAAVALANGVSFALARREATINRTVLDATTDGILLFDLEGNVIVSNAAMSSMLTDLFELPADATMLEMADDLADRTVDPAAFRAGIAELVEDPEREQLAEYELVSGRWVHRYTTPVRYSDGTLMGRLFLLREITA